MYSPREMAQAAPRRLVAHILPPQAPGEPSAAEVKLRMIRRLEELKRDGIGGSTLARLLASLKQQPPPMGDDRAVRLLRLTLQRVLGGSCAAALIPCRFFSVAAGSYNPGSISREACATHGRCAPPPRQVAQLSRKISGQPSYAAIYTAESSWLRCSCDTRRAATLAQLTLACVVGDTTGPRRRAFQTARLFWICRLGLSTG